LFARHLSLSARKKTKESIKEKIIEKSKKQQSAILDYRTELLENTLRNENFDRPQYQHALRMLNTLNPDHKNVIEFGAGRGEFARLLREKGYSVFFTDINPENVKWAKDNGFNALHLDANEKLNQFTDQQFDGAIMLEVIEHIPKAFFFLKEVNRILNRGGYLVLSTPNPYFLWHRLSILFGNPISGDGYHYRFFTHRSLIKTLNTLNFQIVTQMPSIAGFGINFLLKKLGMKTVNLKLPEFMHGLFARNFYLIARKY